jgi:hypothetical protein
MRSNILYSIISFWERGWSETESTVWPTVPAPDDECGAVGGMIGKDATCPLQHPDTS